MGIGIDGIFDYIDIFLLVLIRVTAFFIVSPIFGSKNVSSLIKVGFGLMLAFIITPTLGIGIVEQYNGYMQYILLIFSEFMIGAILGFVSYMAFLSLYLAGQIIDMQIGFGIVNVFDTQSNIQIPVTANLYNIIALLIFFVINGHHMLISSIFYSYKLLPIGMASMNGVLLESIIKMFGEMFIIGFKVAAPIIAAIFITNVILGILARTIPQMNVFVVGMPLKILIGMATIIVIIPIFSVVMDSIVNGMYHDLDTVLKDMMP